SGHAAAGLDAHLAGREIQLVVTDHDVPERQLVETRVFGDGVAGVIHEGLRLLQEDLDAAEKAFAHQARKLAAPGTEAVRTGDRLDRHEPDVVPLAGVAGAGIAEPDEQQHRRWSTPRTTLPQRLPAREPLPRPPPRPRPPPLPPACSLAPIW